MKRILMIAFHFPPMARSSGIQRTLRFVRYLPEYGWQPIVLSAHCRSYVQTSPDLLADIPEGVKVVRAPAWDTSRHLSLGGRYPGFLSRPDRWVTWWPGAVMVGMRLIRQHRPDFIWSTYPIATAHAIAASLAARSDVPWVADFRDPMAQHDYPSDPKTWRSFEEIEQRTVSMAAFSTFTTPSAVAMYRERYPAQVDRLGLLENGYDDEVFAGMQGGGALNPGKLTLLHSGIVYPSERDPTQLFAALAHLKQRNPEIAKRLVIRFRASVHDDLLRGLASKYGLSSQVELHPPVGYRDALTEMLSADGLLILQGASCNQQIPAKLYEYLRTERPVVVLADQAGDTARAAQQAGIVAGAALEDADAIGGLLESFCLDPQAGTLPDKQVVADSSRRERTRQLADLLNRIDDAGGKL